MKIIWKNTEIATDSDWFRNPTLLVGSAIKKWRSGEIEKHNVQLFVRRIYSLIICQKNILPQEYSKAVRCHPLMLKTTGHDPRPICHKNILSQEYFVTIICQKNSLSQYSVKRIFKSCPMLKTTGQDPRPISHKSTVSFKCRLFATGDVPLS